MPKQDDTAYRGVAAQDVFIEPASEKPLPRVDTERLDMRVPRIEEQFEYYERIRRSIYGPLEQMRMWDQLVVSDLRQLGSAAAQAEWLENCQRMRRSIHGPLEQMRTWDEFAGLDLRRLGSAMAEFDTRFHLPTASEIGSLLKEIHGSLEAEKRRQGELISACRNDMLRMHSPWLDMQDSFRSISGFAGLHGIGEVLKSVSVFGHDVSEVLRLDLGDWRKEIIWPKEIFTNFGARADFYSDLGFNSAVANFPGETFRECLEQAGIGVERPSLVKLYGRLAPDAEDTEDEEGLSRTNEAHDWLMRLETQVRRFINEKMTEVFGPDWPKHKLPNGVYEKWQEKKQKANQGGRGEFPLIAYADFTDYSQIICKRDNWRIFEPCFSRQDNVRESFQRLYPIRVDTMHARPITQDDELFLFVESRRLMKGMGK